MNFISYILKLIKKKYHLINISVLIYINVIAISVIAQLTGAVEYIECCSAKSKTPSNKCPGYNTKQSDDEASVTLEL